MLQRIEEQRENVKNALIESVESGEIKIDHERLEKELKSLDKTYDVYYNQIKSGEVVFPDHIKKDIINKVYDEDIINQNKQSIELFSKITSGEIKIENNEVSPRAPYPVCTPGDILYTKDGAIAQLFGHSGIVYSNTAVTESYAGSGVKYYSLGTWFNPGGKDNIIGAKCSEISSALRTAAGNRAFSHCGKPYNYEFTKKNLTDKFYCSQLVYEAFKYAAGKDLSNGSTIVMPVQLVTHPYVTQIYVKQ